MNMQHELPAITLATNDYNRLLFTAMIQEKHNRPAAEFLLMELRRAKVCHPGSLPEDVVSTNCRVIYRLNDEPKSRTHLLVHPEDLIWSGAEISVTTPLGTALLGLRVGDSMPFIEADGTRHVVLVEGIGLRFLDDGSTVTRAPGSVVRI
ncbi:regulator of nucleoside diphosphate kinase [Microvirga lupini]|uniref:Regulator of nucleoside diphosphate kinase n=1 Tax=Microvirga lupini TaxID=420324 RepID=A0A7W4VL28_9HYPH|nr:GreA/GreB family elongation factor [Microvirga lupini]MBB3019165.1 regulator of nucleoside diphosphate kinase [Microvirga lupini]